jgi:hypothetical protein
MDGGGEFLRISYSATYFYKKLFQNRVLILA